jgi:two-component system NtrC family sensor kinase
MADACHVCDRFERLIARTGQPYVSTDFDGRITRVNAAFAALLGYAPGDLTGRSVYDITPPALHDRTRAALAVLGPDGSPQRYEKLYIHRDGSTVPVAVVADLDRDEHDRVVGYYAFVTDLTERERALEDLRASEERYRELFDDAPFGYHVIDTEGVLQSVNRAECEMLGYTKAEMVGRPIFGFIAEEQRDEARRAVAERVAGIRPAMAVERTYLTKDGRRLILHIENRLLRGPGGQIVGIRSTLQDITQRKQVEAALVASERRLRALFEGIDDAVFVHDLEGHILDANPAASRKLGYSRDELLKLMTVDVDDPEFAAGYEERLEAQLRHGHLSCEGRHRTKDGRVIPVDINTSTIQLDNQPAVLAVIRDITERKALEETRRQFAEAQMRYAREMEQKARALARSESRHRQLAESLLDALVVTDPEGRITLFNRAAERTFGYRADEVLGRALSLLIPDGLRGGPVPSVCEALRQRDPRVLGQTIEVSGRRRSGEGFPLELSVAAVETEGSVELVGSIRDLTERHRMRALLMQSEKLASIGLLSAGVAHEINNPLAYIANNLAVLERDLDGILAMVAAYEEAADAPESEALARARAIAEELDWPYVRSNLGRLIGRTRDGVQRVASIVANLRGLARTTPPRLEPAALADLLESGLEMLQARMRRAHIEVRVENPGLPKLACVPSQIGQVLLNLLVNAVQALEQGRRDDGNLISIRLGAEPGVQFVEIQDNGPGIDADALPRIFDPFYTTKPLGEGTGLGLAISHGIVSGHGGQIEVESRPGAGALFRVVLPTRGTAGRPGI